MPFDAEAPQPAEPAEPALPLPDHVPEDLMLQYGAGARRTVRRSRSRRYPVYRRLREAWPALRDADLWLATLTVFAWSIVSAGAVGALSYAVVLMPGGAVFVVLPMAMLLGLSFAVARSRVRRRARRTEPTAF